MPDISKVEIDISAKITREAQEILDRAPVWRAIAEARANDGRLQQSSPLVPGNFWRNLRDIQERRAASAYEVGNAFDAYKEIAHLAGVCVAELEKLRAMIGPDACLALDGRRRVEPAPVQWIRTPIDPPNTGY